MPRSTQHQLLLMTLSQNQAPLLKEFTQIILQCGCTVEQMHTAMLGDGCAITVLLSGTWSVIAKMEAMLPSVEQRFGLRTLAKRIAPSAEAPASAAPFPYSVQITAPNRPEVLHEVCAFFADQSLSVVDLRLESYVAQRTWARLLNITLVIDLPETTHLAALREQFMIYCEDRNLDAVLEPYKN